MTFEDIILTFFVVLFNAGTVQLESADSVNNSVCQEVSKLTDWTRVFNIFGHAEREAVGCW
jgi:hypothetical protein